MAKWQKIALCVAIAILCAAIGFFTGRKTSEIKTITKTEYVQLPAVHDTIDNPVPIKVDTPIDTCRIIEQCIRDGKYSELFPNKTVTEVITKRDTIMILSDWATTRYYNETLFDVDTLGKCTYEAEVQYNELRMMGYTYIPIEKKVTETKQVVRTISPFVGAGITLQPSVEVEVGMFYNEKWGASLSGRYNIKYEGNDFLSKYDIGLKVIRKF